MQIRLGSFARDIEARTGHQDTESAMEQGISQDNLSAGQGLGHSQVYSRLNEKGYMMFLKIADKIIINEDYISHCILDYEEDLVGIVLKSGLMFLFADKASSYSMQGPKKQYTYISSQQFNSLKCYLKGDFCRNVA